MMSKIINDLSSWMTRQLCLIVGERIAKIDLEEEDGFEDKE